MNHKSTSPKEDGQLNMFADQKPPKRKYQRNAPQKVAATSIISFKQELAKGTFKGIQKEIICLLSDDGIMTRRQMAKSMGKELGSLCNALSTLQKKKLVEVGEEKKCPTTGKVVSWFRLCRNDKGNGR